MRTPLPLTVVDRGEGGGEGNTAPAEGWRFEVRDSDGPVYRAGNRKACERWIRARDRWAEHGYIFEDKSRYLDHVEGQLVFDEGGHSYGVQWS